MSPQTKSTLAACYGTFLLGIVAGCFIVAVLMPETPGELRPEDKVAAPSFVRCERQISPGITLGTIEATP